MMIIRTKVFGEGHVTSSFTAFFFGGDFDFCFFFFAKSSWESILEAVVCEAYFASFSSSLTAIDDSSRHVFPFWVSSKLLDFNLLFSHDRCLSRRTGRRGLMVQVLRSILSYTEHIRSSGLRDTSKTFFFGGSSELLPSDSKLVLTP